MIASIIVEPAIQPIQNLPDHLSWSAVQAHRTCPRRYYYRYIAKAPEENRSAALVFGSAIHRAIERAQESRIAGLGLPPIDEVMLAFESGWAELAHAGEPVAFATGDDEGTLRKQAQGILESFLAQAATDVGEVIAIEHEARVFISLSAPPLLARIDLIELVGDELVITDFKTSRSKWNQSKTTDNLAQLIVYGRAIQPMARALGARRIVTRFVVLTKAKKPQVQVLTPRPTETDVTRLEELVTDTWASISGGGAFPRCEGWQCKQCPFAKRCLGRAPST